jgi:hypothetical protein
MTRMDEAELNKQALDAGSKYVTQKFAGAPLEDRQIAVNACASGFFMGVRFAEKYLTEKVTHDRANKTTVGK